MKLEFNIWLSCIWIQMKWNIIQLLLVCTLYTTTNSCGNETPYWMGTNGSFVLALLANLKISIDSKVFPFKPKIAISFSRLRTLPNGKIRYICPTSIENLIYHRCKVRRAKQFSFKSIYHQSNAPVSSTWWKKWR